MSNDSVTLDRVYNFSAGPSMMPLPVLERAARDMVCYPGAGCSVMEMLTPGGLILADDTLWNGKVYADPLPHDAQTKGLLAFNDRLMEDRRVEAVMLPLRDGLTLVRKKNSL